MFWCPNQCCIHFEERSFTQSETLFSGFRCERVAGPGTVINSDKLFFLQEGRVLEQGTHAELIALQGGYFKLVEQQQKAAQVVSEAPSPVGPSPATQRPCVDTV